MSTQQPEISDYSADELLQASVPDAFAASDATRIRTRWLMGAACNCLQRQEELLVRDVKARDLSHKDQAERYLLLACERLEWLKDHAFAAHVRRRIEDALNKLKRTPRRAWLGPISERAEDWQEEHRWVYDKAEEKRARQDSVSGALPKLTDGQKLCLHKVRAKEEAAILAELRVWLDRLARDIWPAALPRPNEEPDYRYRRPRPKRWGGAWISHSEAARILRYMSRQSGIIADGATLRMAIKNAPEGDPLAELRDKTVRIAKDPKSGRLRRQAVEWVARERDVDAESPDDPAPSAQRE